MILVEKLTFFHLLCLSTIDRENVFVAVLDNKEAFKDHKKNCVHKTLISIAKLDTLASLCGPIFTFERRFIFYFLGEISS